MKEAEARGMLVDQIFGRDLEGDLMIGFLDGLGAHNDHASLLALAGDEQRPGQCLTFGCHDGRKLDGD